MRRVQELFVRNILGEIGDDDVAELLANRLISLQLETKVAHAEGETGYLLIRLKPCGRPLISFRSVVNGSSANL